MSECLYSSTPSDLRHSLDLCEEENEFIRKRKHFVFEAMKKLLGKEGPNTLHEVPDYKTPEESLYST